MSMTDGSPKLLRIAHGIRLWDLDSGEDRYAIDTPGLGLWKDRFDCLSQAIRVFNNLVNLCDEQRGALSMDDPAGADKILDLKLDLQRRGGHRAVWGVLREDGYETSFGDGYYAYLEAVFASEDDAKKFAAENPQHMINWHIRKYEIGLINGEPALLTKPTEREPVNLDTLLGRSWK